MADIREFEPLFGTWYIEKLLGEGSYGKVYRAKRQERGSTFYSAIKHISIEDTPDCPADTMASLLMREIEISYQLRGNSHFVSYEDSVIYDKPNGAGYDVFIRMSARAGGPRAAPRWWTCPGCRTWPR